MRSRSGPWIALVVAGALALATPYEVHAASPPLPESETPPDDEGEDAPDADSAEAPADEREARVAEASGTIVTKEGSTDYKAGDYIVSNDPEEKDGWAVSAIRFVELYEGDEG